jgi:hypothetical protein
MKGTQAAAVATGIFVLLVLGWLALATPSPLLAQGEGCLSCHDGLEPIREEGSAMLAAIKGYGQAAGDPEGCVVCHGGDPQADVAEEAHEGAPAGESRRWYALPGLLHHGGHARRWQHFWHHAGSGGDG